MSGLEALLAQQVIGLNEAIDDRTAALLVAGTGITLTYNDGAGTLTIANTGLGGSTGSTDNRILRSDGTGGATVQNSAVTIDDNGNISGLGTVACGAITASGAVNATNLRCANGIMQTRYMNNANDTWSAFEFPASVNALTFSPGVAGLFRFEGTTSGHPALKRSGATLQVKLADDSADAALACGAITASGNIALTGSNPQVGFGGSGGAGFPYVEHSSGALNLGHTYATVLAVGSDRITCQQPFQLRAYTVATLPSAATHAGRWVQVTDSSVTTNGSIVAGGGSNRVPLFSDGTNWIVK